MAWTIQAAPRPANPLTRPTRAALATRIGALDFLEVGGKRVASTFSFTYSGTFYLYNSAFDAASNFGKHLSQTGSSCQRLPSCSIQKLYPSAYGARMRIADSRSATRLEVQR